MWIYSWNPHSEGATLLAQEMEIRKIKHENSRFVGTPRKKVINWGSTQLPEQVLRCQVINRPENVRLCSNKLDFFRSISQDNREILPDWCTSLREAVAWVGEGHTVIARRVLNGHSAAGLVVMDRDNPNSFVEAPLYTKYVKKKDEYRVHVISGQVVDVQKKVLRREKAESGEEINWKVRNLDNGFIYQRENIQVPESVKQQAIDAVRIIGLTFGAVDIIFNQKDNRPYTLEINSAPGITGTTVQNYANALRNL